MLVNFTADWCVTCKINERTTLSSPRVAKAMREAKTHTTWTEQDAEYEREVQALGRAALESEEVAAILAVARRLLSAADTAAASSAGRTRGGLVEHLRERDVLLGEFKNVEIGVSETHDCGSSRHWVPNGG